MERPPSKDKALNAYVDYQLAELDKFKKSPYVNSYLSIRKLVDKGNLTINNMADEAELDFDSEKFKGVEKFLSKQKEYYEQMEYFRGKMTSSEKKEVDISSLGMAEQIALSKK